MVNLKNAGGAVVARDIDLAPPAALAREVREALPGCTLACASRSNVYFGLGGRLLKAPYTRFGPADYWVDAAGASAVATMARGASTEEVLRRARPLGADFAELPPSAWVDPHPLPRREPVPNILADLGTIGDDYMAVPPSTWGVPRQPKKPVVLDDSDFAPLGPGAWE